MIDDIKIAMSHCYALNADAENIYTMHNELIHFAHNNAVQSNKIKLVYATTLKDNIEQFNSKLNEITSAYALLHNFDNDNINYMGLCQYRRFFPSDTLEKFKLYDADILIADPAKLAEVDWKYGLEMQYKVAHVAADFDLFKSVISNMTNHDSMLFNNWLRTNKLFAPCNLVVMKKQLFKKWLSELLTVIIPLCEKIDVSNRDNYQKRACGFLAERFTSWWIFSNMIHYKYKTLSSKCEFYPDWKPVDTKDKRGNYDIAN